MARRARIRHSPYITPEKCDNCNKLAYRTQEEAEVAAFDTMSNRGGELRVYRSPDCNLWHLTSNANSY